jgi:short-subunit dehydrogenase
MTERRVSLPRARGKPAAMSTASSRALAVVTGASSGIGLELAKQFASNGYDLVVAAEDAELAGAARELEGLGAQVEAVQVDLATERSTVHLAKRVVEDMVARDMPGPTDTEFFERAEMLDTKVGSGKQDDPADVAREGFEALMAGKQRAVSASLSTKLQGRGSRLLPDRATAAMHRKMAEPGSGDDGDDG